MAGGDCNFTCSRRAKGSIPQGRAIAGCVAALILPVIALLPVPAPEYTKGSLVVSHGIGGFCIDI